MDERLRIRRALARLFALLLVHAELRRLRRGERGSAAVREHGTARGRRSANWASHRNKLSRRRRICRIPAGRGDAAAPESRKSAHGLKTADRRRLYDRGENVGKRRDFFFRADALADVRLSVRRYAVRADGRRDIFAGEPVLDERLRFGANPLRESQTLHIHARRAQDCEDRAGFVRRLHAALPDAGRVPRRAGVHRRRPARPRAAAARLANRAVWG